MRVDRRDGLERVVLASGNRGKLGEFVDLFEGTGIEVVAQGLFGVGDIDESGRTFVENALLKARHAARITGLPALGDDSGLCVDALDGAPGLYSARYAGSHGDARANVDKLLEVMRDVPETQRTAHFVAVIVLLRHADDPQPVIAEGRWHGRIALQPGGEGGFGYDPVFFDPVRGCTAAELAPRVKHAVSHRGLAMAALLSRLATTASIPG